MLRSGPTEQHSAAADCPCRKDRARGRPLPEVAWSFENPDGSKQKSADQAWAAARLHWQREACARSAVGRPASAAYLLGAPQVGRRWQRGHCRSRPSLVAVIAAARTDPTNDGGGSSPGFGTVGQRHVRSHARSIRVVAQPGPGLSTDKVHRSDNLQRRPTHVTWVCPKQRW